MYVIISLIQKFEFWTFLTTLFIAWTGWKVYTIYKKQAEISETSNLMVLWQEHNTIMARINDASISQYPIHKYLMYFELIMYLQRICNMYSKIWKNNKKLKERFEVLFDGTIGANMKTYYYPCMIYLYIFRNRKYDKYGVDSIEKYYDGLRKRNEKYKDYYIQCDRKQLDKDYKKI